MATSGESTIRGINVDALAKGFSDEEAIYKKFVTVTNTAAREIRWYQKTAGFVDSTDTTGITASQIYNVAHGALPPVAEQSWTRMTSYIKNFKVESPWISIEDIKDSDVSLLATNVRDLTRAVAHQVDYRILDVISGGTALSGTAAGAGWDDASAGNPIQDLVSGAAEIRVNGYNISNLTTIMHPYDYKKLLNYLITVKGSSIPAMSSALAGSGVIMQIVGQDVAVSSNATEGQVLIISPQVTATWKTFMPITAVTIEEPLVGMKIRVAEEGECLLTDPKSCYLIKSTNA